jgi:hypothetical protein
MPEFYYDLTYLPLAAGRVAGLIADIHAPLTLARGFISSQMRKYAPQAKWLG